jgi:hypothetical protein
MVGVYDAVVGRHRRAGHASITDVDEYRADGPLASALHRDAAEGVTLECRAPARPT